MTAAVEVALLVRSLELPLSISHKTAVPVVALQLMHIVQNAIVNFCISTENRVEFGPVTGSS